MQSAASSSIISAATLLVIGLAGASARAQYTYGRYLEPPTDTILQGIGNWPDDEDDYLEALEPYEQAIRPAFGMEFINVAPSKCAIHNHAASEAFVLNTLNGLHEDGRIPVICIGFYDYDSPGHPAIDDLVADATAPSEILDQIHFIGRAMRQYQQAGLPDEIRPIYCRIGTEFNNPAYPEQGAHHAGDFPIAFRKTVDILRSEGAHCAYIWCWWAGADPDFMAVNPTTQQPLWYPGKTYVDWFGLDFYKRNEFTDSDGLCCSPSCSCVPSSRECPGVPSKLANVEAFLAAAHQEGCPVFVETSCVEGIEMGSAAVISEYLDEMLDFVWGHPVIKALMYVNHDWQGPFCWKNGKLSDDAQVFSHWVNVGLAHQFIGLESIGRLNGYGGWVGLGNALAGTAGEPNLWANGTVMTGQQAVTLHLTNAKPSSFATLFIGLTKSYAPHKGGVMVPAPYTWSQPLPTNAGSIDLNFNWPLTVATLHFQFWIQDSAGPYGFSASNGLTGINFSAPQSQGSYRPCTP